MEELKEFIESGGEGTPAELDIEALFNYANLDGNEYLSDQEY
jgi:hypothetical protein